MFVRRDADAQKPFRYLDRRAGGRRDAAHELERQDLRRVARPRTPKATERFLMFELVGVGSRWGDTQLTGRRGDTATDSWCERVAPAFTRHSVSRPVVSHR
jgi:hypothetical protein